MKFIIVDSHTQEIVANNDYEENLIDEVEDIVTDTRIKDLIVYKKYAVVNPMSIKKTADEDTRFRIDNTLPFTDIYGKKI